MDGVSVRAEGGRGRVRKRGLPLGLVILRYFAYVLAAALALALGTYVAFGVLVGTGAVYPANHGDTALAETSARRAGGRADPGGAHHAPRPASEPGGGL